MTNFNPKNPSKYLGTNKFITFFVTRNRQPIGSDYRQPETGTLYSVGTVWQVGKDPTTGFEGELWMLSKIVSNVAYWVHIGSSGEIAVDSFQVQAATAPGVNPVTPDATGLVTVNAALVAAHSVPIETRTRALNAYNVEVQLSSLVTPTPVNSNAVGLSSFNTNQFDFDATSGMVSLKGSTVNPAITAINPDTGANVTPLSTGVLKAHGQNPASTNGVETYNIAADELGIRLKTPFLGSYIFQNNASTTFQDLASRNTDTNSASYARLAASVVAASAADAFFIAAVEAVANYAFGIDNSDSQKFKWTFNPSAPTPSSGTELLVLESNGNFEQKAGQIVHMITPGAYPYTAVATDYYIRVDTTAAARTINLPNTTTTGRTYVIKDSVGNATANNITVTTPGGAVLIDGAATNVIGANYGFRRYTFNGTGYEVN